MSEKYIVVQGAICQCQYGQAPDKIKVLTQNKHYANDKDASSKLIVSNKDIGAITLENNTFGTCPKMGTPPPPCKPVITEWQGFYEKVTLSNGGKILLEDSEATCAVAGSACIKIIDHGQRSEASFQNFLNEDKEILMQINPLIDPEEFIKEAMVSHNIEVLVKENTEI